jgi:glycosyltransferase involved in cell wall biosynthesis
VEPTFRSPLAWPGEDGVATLKITVNGAILTRGISGSARATQDVIEALRTIPAAEVDVLEPQRPRRGRLSNAAFDASWDLWACARKMKQDLHVSPCNIGAAPRGVPHLLIAYDTMLFDHPELFDPGFVRYSRALVPFSLRHAALTLTMSDRARERLSGLAGGHARVEVLPWRGSGERRAAVWPQRYRVLVLGATEPHKRQAVAVEAVRRVRDETGADVRLNVVGPAGRAEDKVMRALASHDAEGRWARRRVGLSSPEVRRLLDHSWVLLQPSADEGFGLPLLEATERGVAVVHSGAGAMSEVLPSAAAGLDSGSLASALAHLLDESAWRVAVAVAAHETARFTPAAFEARLHQLIKSI